MRKPSVLFSHGCCNELPWTQWLKTAWMYSLTVLEGRGPKFSVVRPAFLPEASGKNRSLSFPASRGHLWSLACGLFCLHRITQDVFKTKHSRGLGFPPWGFWSWCSATFIFRRLSRCYWLPPGLRTTVQFNSSGPCTLWVMNKTYTMNGWLNE